MYLEKLGITIHGAGTDGISRPPLDPRVSPVRGFTGRGFLLLLDKQTLKGVHWKVYSASPR